MLVVVIAVGGVPVSFVHIVDVVIVRHGQVPAVWPVLMFVLGVRQVRQRVLVIVPRVRRVGVALVYIVDVPRTRHAGVAAVWPVLVLVVAVTGVGVVVWRCHCCSLLCWTASATMCATC